VRILFVCLGNICRSPTAEAAFREALAAARLDGEVEVDSAGTGDWHIGDPPDPRMVQAAADAGLQLEGRARLVTAADFDHFDQVVAMDRANHRNLRGLAPDDESRSKIRLLREFEDDPDSLEVPDPYYGGPAGFAQVVDIVRAAARGLVRHVGEQLEEQRR
jgi:protein-tyrosine phosphatase